MTDGPHQAGISLLRNFDIESFPGALKVAKQPQSYFPALNTVTFTVDPATNIFTAGSTIESGALNMSGAAVYLTSTGNLPVADPVGLSVNTVYYIIRVTATTFKLATSYKNAVGSAAGTAMDITDAGTNVHTIHPIAIGTINWILQDPRNNYIYMLDSNGRTWFVPTGSKAYLLHNSAIEDVDAALTNASGNGLALHAFSNTTSTYLFTFRNAVVDVIDVYGDTAIEALAWSNAWQNLNTGSGVANSHHAIRSQDDAIYFCDNRYVGSIIEKVGQTFVPATAASFTYNNQALDLPTYEVAQCLEELGVNLLAGGNTFDKIYPWDRISNSFSLPMSVGEYAIKRMKNIGGTVYVLAGSQGNIYTTQGSYVKFFKSIPKYLTNNAYSVLASPITWGGIASVGNALLFGLAGTTSGSSGVYRLYLDGRLIHDNTPASGSKNVTAIWAKDEFYLMGYAGGADNFSALAAQYSASYLAIAHSELYPIGTKTKKGKYSEIELQLANPASTGGVRVSYRRDKISSFTTIETFAMDGTAMSFKKDCGLTDIENIQFQIEAHGNAEIKEVRLIP